MKSVKSMLLQCSYSMHFHAQFWIWIFKRPLCIEGTEKVLFSQAQVFKGLHIETLWGSVGMLVPKSQLQSFGFLMGLGLGSGSQAGGPFSGGSNV